MTVHQLNQITNWLIITSSSFITLDDFVLYRSLLLFLDLCRIKLSTMGDSLNFDLELNMLPLLVDVSWYSSNSSSKFRPRNWSTGCKLDAGIVLEMFAPKKLKPLKQLTRSDSALCQYSRNLYVYYRLFGRIECKQRSNRLTHFHQIQEFSSPWLYSHQNSSTTKKKILLNISIFIDFVLILVTTLLLFIISNSYLSSGKVLCVWGIVTSVNGAKVANAAV